MYELGQRAKDVGDRTVLFSLVVLFVYIFGVSADLTFFGVKFSSPDLALHLCGLIGLVVPFLLLQFIARVAHEVSERRIAELQTYILGPDHVNFITNHDGDIRTIGADLKADASKRRERIDSLRVVFGAIRNFFEIGTPLLVGLGASAVSVSHSINAVKFLLTKM